MRAMRFLLFLSAAAFAPPESPDGPAYCAIETDGAMVERVRPADDEPSIDDVNWFARPLPNAAGRWLIGFASHNQNYLYDLTSGRRVKIPDRSDAVGTPDGRYVTVPSLYTPDETIRFYDAAPLIDHLDRGVDADALEPAYALHHPDLRKVYYQSTGVLSSSRTASNETTVYRMMFSGTRGEAGFRIVDFRFDRDRSTGRLQVEPTAPMKLCPEIPNDLNTPFLSKDARYVVSYASGSAEREYTPGSSLKIFRIREVFPESGTTRCEEVLDFGFAAGKADFSFDQSKLTFHISKGAYLTPFVSGGLDAPAVTDIVVVDLTTNAAGEITGYSNLARVTTSLKEGVGSYFPAFFPDGKLFYIGNGAPKNSDATKHFYFKVVDPSREQAMGSVFQDPARRELAAALGRLWESACAAEAAAPLEDHEAPWVVLSLSRTDCQSLVRERWSPAYPARENLNGICELRP
jgi:hypothetical protein